MLYDEAIFLFKNAMLYNLRLKLTFNYLQFWLFLISFAHTQRNIVDFSSSSNFVDIVFAEILQVAVERRALNLLLLNLFKAEPFKVRMVLDFLNTLQPYSLLRVHISQPHDQVF